MITEGVNDPGIFKAIFLAGGPGSGKSFVVGRTSLTTLGFKVVNSDLIFEKELAKAGLEATQKNIMSTKGQGIRDNSKRLTSNRMRGWINGRLGLVIDGTGKDYTKIQKQKQQLESLGYETALILVNTDEETAANRNIQRGERGGRALPTKTVKTMWSQVQNNIGKFQHAFGNNFIVVDNSESSDINKGTLSAYRKMWQWARKAPQDRRAVAWINKERKKNMREDAEYDAKPGGHEWGTDKGTEYFKKLTPGEDPKKFKEFVKESGPAHETKAQYKKDNAILQTIHWDLTKEDIQELESEAEQFDWQQALDLGLYDEDELEILDNTEYPDEEEHGDELKIHEVLSVTGRMKRRFAARRNRQKLKVARGIALRRGSSPDRLKRRATRGARGMVYKRLLRGRDRSKLPPAERSRLETMVQRFQPLVSRLAVKMLPNMRKMEINRMKSRGGKKAATSKKYKPAKPIAKKAKTKKTKAPKPKKR